jgi:hypothetical protein
MKIANEDRGQESRTRITVKESQAKSDGQRVTDKKSPTKNDGRTIANKQSRMNSTSKKGISRRAAHLKRAS